MRGIERVYCDRVIRALVYGAWHELLEVSSAEALQTLPNYGKEDTKGFDAIPETAIIDHLADLDPGAIVVTEERDEQEHRRWPTEADAEHQPLMFFSDPTDSSAQFEKFLVKLSEKEPTAKIGSLMSSGDPVALWDSMFCPPAVISGSSSSVTCVYKGKVIFSVILNLVTGTIFVATSIGVFWCNLRDISDSGGGLTLADVCRKGKILLFPGVKEKRYGPDECKKFAAFLGKSGYKENLRDSGIFGDNPDSFAHNADPPGPPRILYLSELQKGYGPVGTILANGEKIAEWMPWLSFVKFARNENGERALRAFEVSIPRPWTKNGVLMSTSPPYSLFCDSGSEQYLNFSRLRDFPRPSQFRCMLVIVPWDNAYTIHQMQRYSFREVTDFF